MQTAEITTKWTETIERLQQDRTELLAALNICRRALAPYDQGEPRDYKSDRQRLSFAHQAACVTINSMKEQS
jgi:hypothetical protein